MASSSRAADLVYQVALDDQDLRSVIAPPSRVRPRFDAASVSLVALAAALMSAPMPYLRDGVRSRGRRDPLAVDTSRRPMVVSGHTAQTPAKETGHEPAIATTWRPLADATAGAALPSPATTWRPLADAAAGAA
jgi:hypothetical protein